MWRTAVEVAADVAEIAHSPVTDPTCHLDVGHAVDVEAVDDDSASIRRSLVALTAAVQDALDADATTRMQAGKPALSIGGQEALADKVLRGELQRIDTERSRTRGARLSADDEQALVERVLALSVGLGPVELVLADQSVEEVVATRFDLVFVYRSDGSVEQLDERLWASRGGDWTLGCRIWLARRGGRSASSTQVPLLVMRLGDGLRLAATRDVSQHVSFALRRNTLGKVTLADLVGFGMMPAGGRRSAARRACVRPRSASCSPARPGRARRRWCGPALASWVRWRGW